MQFPVIRISGTHYEVGLQIGQTLADPISDKLEKNRILCGEQLEAKLRATQPYLDLVQRHFPHLLEELKGMSKGAGVPFEELFLANVQEVIDDNPYDATRCTVIAIPKEVGWLIGYNEDWLPESLPHLYVFDLTIDGVGIFGLGYAHELASSSIALNSFGLIQAINELPSPEIQIGVPKNIIAAAILRTPTLDSGLQLVKSMPRGAAFNHALFQKNEFLDIEFTAKLLGIKRCKGEKYVHANSYLVLPHAPVRNPISESRTAKITALLSGINTVDDLKKVLSDRSDPPVCREETIASVVIDMTEAEIHIAFGQPTPKSYVEYSFKHVLQ